MPGVAELQILLHGTDCRQLLHHDDSPKPSQRLINSTSHVLSTLQASMLEGTSKVRRLKAKLQSLGPLPCSI